MLGFTLVSQLQCLHSVRRWVGVPWASSKAETDAVKLGAVPQVYRSLLGVRTGLEPPSVSCGLYWVLYVFY